MSEGYVYILSNVSMPGLVKIGRSVSSGRNRAKEIYQTGVPTPFNLEFELYVDDCVELESDMHNRLLKYRVNPNRGFFKICEYEAISELLDEYSRRLDMTVQSVDLIVDQSSTYRYMGILERSGIDMAFPEVATMLSNIPENELIGISQSYHRRKIISKKEGE